MYLQKEKKHKNLKRIKIFFVGILKVTHEKSLSGVKLENKI
jgi:hypothetical protein